MPRLLGGFNTSIGPRCSDPAAGRPEDAGESSKARSAEVAVLPRPPLMTPSLSAPTTTSSLSAGRHPVCPDLRAIINRREKFLKITEDYQISVKTILAGLWVIQY
jgi:hypothetical protein